MRTGTSLCACACTGATLTVSTVFTTYTDCALSTRTVFGICTITSFPYGMVTVYTFTFCTLRTITICCAGTSTALAIGAVFPANAYSALSAGAKRRLGTVTGFPLAVGAARAGTRLTFRTIAVFRAFTRAIGAVGAVCTSTGAGNFFFLCLCQRKLDVRKIRGILLVGINGRNGYLIIDNRSLHGKLGGVKHPRTVCV